VVFVVDDLGAWLVAWLADGSRRRLVNIVLGDEQERALVSAAKAAVQLTAAELFRSDAEAVEHTAMVVNEVFRGSAPQCLWRLLALLLGEPLGAEVREHAVCASAEDL
jgi:hypothetical protein